MSAPDDRPLLITSALPYANGPLHLGHVAGAYLPADVFARHARLTRGLPGEPRAGGAGSEPLADPGVLFLCGTDEHGVAITVNAEKEGCGYREYVDRWHAEIRDFMARWRISFDHFSRTTHVEPHFALSQEFFLRLLRAGNLVRREVLQQYSVKQGRFLADRYVQGTCYLCGHAPARGDECPRCGAWLDAARLLNASAVGDPSDALELRTAWQFELEMSPITAGGEALRAAFGADFVAYLARLREHARVNVRTMVFDKLIEGEGLRGRPITRDLPWGVPLPERDLDGGSLGDVSGKVLYVWFDAPIGYVSATIEWARDLARDETLWRRYWIVKGAQRGPRLLHFVGKDNIPFHAIVFPAMLAGQAPAQAGDALPDGRPHFGPRAGERWVLPEAVPANEFYNLEGRKFSTSGRWTLDIDRLLELFGLDALRWYLVRSMPETADSQFTYAGLATETNLLADVVGNYAARVLKFVATHRDGTVPQADLRLEPIDIKWLLGFDSMLEGMTVKQPLVDLAMEERRLALRECGHAIDHCRFREASEALLAFGRGCNQLFDAQQPWKLRKLPDPVPCSTSLFTHVQNVATLSVLLAPFVPDAAARLRTMLNLPAPTAWTPTGLKAALRDEARGIDAAPDALRPGHRLGEPGILFAKVDEQLVEAERAALLARAAD